MRFVHIAGILFISFVGYVIYSADNGSMPLVLSKLYDYPGGDTIGHIGLFSVLSFFANALLHPRKLRARRIAIPAGSALLFVFITAEEISQLFIASRTFDLIDLICSYLGILIGRLVQKGLLSSKARLRQN